MRKRFRWLWDESSDDRPEAESRGNRYRTDLLRVLTDAFALKCLNEHWFSDISHARKTISEWRQDYNECRPHSTLNYRTPSEFAANWRKGNSESEGSKSTN